MIFGQPTYHLLRIGIETLFDIYTEYRFINVNVTFSQNYTRVDIYAEFAVVMTFSQNCTIRHPISIVRYYSNAL